MEKFRKAYYEIERLLKRRYRPVIILQGLPGVGKTTVLKQLAREHDGYYINFKDTKVDESQFCSILESKEKLVLMDEVCYLENFDRILKTLAHDMAAAGKQAVITSCSYGALKELAFVIIAHTVELFPLSFEEYLCFAGRISEYGEECEPSAQDLDDFFKLANVPAGLAFEMNKDYFLKVFADNEVAHANHCCVERGILLTREISMRPFRAFLTAHFATWSLVCLNH
jgi:predicted AAA+ superfamily ATPase